MADSVPVLVCAQCLNRFKGNLNTACPKCGWCQVPLALDINAGRGLKIDNLTEAAQRNVTKIKGTKEYPEFETDVIAERRLLLMGFAGEMYARANKAGDALMWWELHDDYRRSWIHDAEKWLRWKGLWDEGMGGEKYADELRRKKEQLEVRKLLEGGNDNGQRSR